MSPINMNSNNNNNFLKALFNREVHGKQLIKTKTKSNNPSTENYLPKIRLKIDTVIPKQALQAGHIIMGFSACNTYIISYTIRSTAANSENQNYLEDNLNQNSSFYYVLHFWRFVPFKNLNPIYSVILFDRNGVNDPSLQIQIMQNRKLTDYILIVGNTNPDPNHVNRSFLTLTKIPNSKCQNCKYSNNKKLTPCEKDSLTLSINYELVPPYPKFENFQFFPENNSPCVLINTGNLIHKIELNNLNSYFKNSPLKCEIYSEKNSKTNLMNHYFNLVNTNGIGRGKKFFKRKNSPLKTVNTNFTVYDIKPDEVLEINYKTFRKKQLADKRYEFIDSDGSSPRRGEEKSLQQSTLKKNSPPLKTLNVNCTTKITRSYIPNFDDEVSTTTSIEEDQQDYPVALPIEMYTSNSQLHMIRNSAFIKNKINVKQITIDIEILSNEIANFVCNLESIHFVFLIDFDATIIEVSPSGQITTLVMLQLQGKQKESNVRQKYESSYILSWQASTQTCKILYKSKLKEANNKLEQFWNPTKEFNKVVKGNLFYYNSDVSCIDNSLLVEEWTSLDELTDWEGVVTLYKERTPPTNFSPSSLSEDFTESDDDF